MAFIRITRIFRFEMAHVLNNHNGLCKNIHGHSYELHITIGGEPKKQKGDAEDGMLIDFSTLKEIVFRELLEDFDHSLVLSSESPGGLFEILKNNNFKVNKLEFQPTCENLIIYFSGILEKTFPEHIELLALKLYETSNNYGEWKKEDNYIG